MPNFSAIRTNFGNDPTRIFCTTRLFLRSRCPTALTTISRLTSVTRGGSSSAMESLCVRRIHFLACAGRGLLEDMVRSSQRVRLT
jgi:hypothetical protein